MQVIHGPSINPSHNVLCVDMCLPNVCREIRRTLNVFQQNLPKCLDKGVNDRINVWVGDSALTTGWEDYVQNLHWNLFQLKKIDGDH